MDARYTVSRIGVLALASALAAPLAARADVTVRPEGGGAFVVEDASGTVARVRIEESTGRWLRDGALFLHTPGTGNLFVGNAAGNPLVAGNNNVAFGASALAAVGNGSRNTAFGSSALQTVSAGQDNAAFGTLALGFNTGSENAALGAFALVLNTTGTGNAA
ncbi:MAG: hypothetical protein KC560_20090, partial [Myxococcales bacterium]|nr:hypothetical protein [Myxococcales bacterium]